MTAPYAARTHNRVEKSQLRTRRARPSAKAVWAIAAVEQVRSEVGFFAQLGEGDELVRLRFSEIRPGEVTGYAVAHPGPADRDGSPE